MPNLTFKEIIKERYSASTSEELFGIIDPPAETCPSIDFVQYFLQNVAVIRSNNRQISRRDSIFLYTTMFDQLESLRLLIMDVRSKTMELKINIWEFGADPTQQYFQENIKYQVEQLRLSLRKIRRLSSSVFSKTDRIKCMIPIDLEEAEFHSAWYNLNMSADQLQYWSQSWEEIAITINQGLNPFQSLKKDLESYSNK